MESKNQIKKILIALAQANSPAPLGYISLHTGIESPLVKLLETMEKKGLVRQCPPSKWSCCGSPMFEITLAARKEILEYVLD